jgi:hypothetical protein
MVHRLVVLLMRLWLVAAGWWYCGCGYWLVLQVVGVRPVPGPLLERPLWVLNQTRYPRYGSTATE